MRVCGAATHDDRQLVTRLPGHGVRVTRHHHPLQVYGLGPLAVRLLGDHDVPVQVDPAVHHLHQSQLSTAAINQSQLSIPTCSGSSPTGWQLT